MFERVPEVACDSIPIWSRFEPCLEGVALFLAVPKAYPAALQGPASVKAVREGAVSKEDCKREAGGRGRLSRLRE